MICDLPITALPSFVDVPSIADRNVARTSEATAGSPAVERLHRPMSRPRFRCAHPGFYPAALPPLEPPRDPLDPFAHVFGRTRIAEPDVALPVHGIEIVAGGGGDAGLLQHAAGEAEAVVAEARDVGIEVERAVHGKEGVEPGARQAV